MWSTEEGWNVGSSRTGGAGAGAGAGAATARVEAEGERDDVMEEWAAKHGFALHKDLCIRHLPGRGRGIVATADIPNKTQLFFIPPGMMLTRCTGSFASQLDTVAPGTPLAAKLKVEVSPYVIAAVSVHVGLALGILEEHTRAVSFSSDKQHVSTYNPIGC
jgi:hypothetical protein